MLTKESAGNKNGESNETFYRKFTDKCVLHTFWTKCTFLITTRGIRHEETKNNLVFKTFDHNNVIYK